MKPALQALLGIILFCLVFGLAIKLFMGPYGQIAYCVLLGAGFMIFLFCLFTRPREVIIGLFRAIAAYILGQP